MKGSALRIKDPARVLGLAAAGATVAISMVIAWAGSRSDGDVAPPPWLSRSLLLAVLLCTPAVSGFIGAWRRDRALLVGAAVGTLIWIPLSFAAIPFAIPAILFLGAAFGSASRSRWQTWLIALAIAALGAAAMVGLVMTSEQRCWVAYPGAAGLIYKDASEAETQQPKGGPGQPIANGCDDGVVTLRGVGLAAVLAIGAVALAVAAPRPRSPSLA